MHIASQATMQQSGAKSQTAAQHAASEQPGPPSSAQPCVAAPQMLSSCPAGTQNSSAAATHRVSQATRQQSGSWAQTNWQQAAESQPGPPTSKQSFVAVPQTDGGC
jgi:hypothetical protein